MQTQPEATPRKEPTENTGSLFAEVVVIPLKYPRANQCSRTIRARPHSGHVPGCQKEIRGFIKAYSHPFPAELNPIERQPESQPKIQPEKQKCCRTHEECSSISKANYAGYAIVA